MLDFVTIIVSVLALANMKSTRGALNRAAKEAFSEIKELITHRYLKTADFKKLTSQSPMEDRFRERIEEQLRTAGANQDRDLLAVTKKFLDSVFDLNLGKLNETIDDFSILSPLSYDLSPSESHPSNIEILRHAEVGASAQSPFAPAEMQKRRIDANLVAERFAPGETAILTIAIRHLSSRVTGKWQSLVDLEPDAGPVQVVFGSPRVYADLGSAAASLGARRSR